MSKRARVIGLAAALFAATTAGMILRLRADRGPSLAEIANMAEAGRLDAAEKGLALLLKRQPGDPGTNLLAAQVAMGRSEPVTNSGVGTDPTPATRALESLARVETRDPKLAGLARPWRGEAGRDLGRPSPASGEGRPNGTSVDSKKRSRRGSSRSGWTRPCPRPGGCSSRNTTSRVGPRKPDRSPSAFMNASPTDAIAPSSCWNRFARK